MKDLQSIKQRFGIIGNYEGLNRALDIAVQVAPTDLFGTYYRGQWDGERGFSSGNS